MSQNTIQLSTIKLVSQFEGLSLKPYHDVGTTWTYGYGATHDMNGNPVTPHTMPLTLEQADQLLAKQLLAYATTVNQTIKTPLSQNQFDACVSLCYNIGQGGFEESTVAKQINAGNIPAAGQAFLLWDKVSGVTNQALLNRRKAEMALFLS